MVHMTLTNGDAQTEGSEYNICNKYGKKVKGSLQKQESWAEVDIREVTTYSNNTGTNKAWNLATRIQLINDINNRGGEGGIPKVSVINFDHKML